MLRCAKRLRFVLFVISFSAMGCNEQSRPFFLDFDIIDIPDAGSVSVRWQHPREASHLPLEETVRLAGIWSDKLAEPSDIYKRRMDVLQEHLRGRKAMVSVRGDTFVIGTSSPITYIVLSTPAKLVLEDGTRLNEWLLQHGYAIFDPTPDLFPEEADRYRAAQSNAALARRGLWGVEQTARTYQKIAADLEHRAELATGTAAHRPRGLVGYFAVQGILLALVIALIFVSRDEPAATAAAEKLLFLPLVLLLPYVIMWFEPNLTRIASLPFQFSERRNFPNGDDYLWSAYYMLISFFGFVWARALLVLFRNGPLGEWRALWSNGRIRSATCVFFVGLWIQILIFAALFRLLGPIEGRVSAFGVSLATVLGFGSSGPALNPALAKGVLTQRIVLAVWLLICGSVLPRLELRSPLRLKWWATGVLGLSSLAALCLVTASIFAGALYGGRLSNNVGQCFWFALANLFRLPYVGTAINSGYLQCIQGLEVHVGFFLSLVGFRTLLAIAAPRSNP